MRAYGYGYSLMFGGQRAAWSLANLNPKYWLDPIGTPASVTYGTPPDQGDLDFEAADFADWVRIGTGVDGTASKETSDPYEGTRNARITRLAGAGAIGFTKLGNHVVGNYYRTGYAVRAQGGVGNNARVYSAGTSFITAAGVWVTGILEGTETSADRPALYTDDSNVGRWAEWDVMTDTNDSVVAIDPVSSTLTGSMANATAAQQGWIDSTSGALRLDGTADRYIYDGTVGDFKFLHYSATNPSNFPSFTIAVVVTAEKSGVIQTIAYSGTPGVYFTIGPDLEVQVIIYGGTGANKITTTVSADGVVALGVPTILIATCDGTTCRIYMDGVEIATSGALAYTGMDADPSSPLSLGGTSYFLQGLVWETLFLDYALDATERALAFEALSVKHSIPLATDELSDAELASWDGLVTWVDPLNVASLTYAAQPTIINGDFGSATGWAVGSWTVGSGEASSAGTTGPIYQATGTIGNRGFIGFDITSASGGTAAVYGGAIGAGKASPGSYTEDITWSLGRTGVYGTTFTGAIDNVTASNISIAAITPRAGTVTSDFAQATATAQPWVDSTTGLVRFDGTADYLQSGAAASAYNFLSDGSGMTLFVVHRQHTQPSGNEYAFDNAGVTSGIGMLNSAQGSGYKTGWLLRASTTYVGITGELPLNTWHVNEVYGDTTTMYFAVNGVAVGNTSAHTDQNATHSLTVGNLASGGSYFAKCQTGDIVAFNRPLSYTQRYRVRTKLAAKYP